MPANKDSDVEINVADAHLIHVRIEARQFDVSTGKKTSVPIIQSFYPNEFETMDKQGAFNGKDVEIVHEPAAKERSAKVIEPKTGGANANANNGDNTGANNNAGNGSGNQGDGDKEKPISRMNKAELFAKYKELYGEDADPDAKNKEVAEAIETKLAEQKENAGNGSGNQDPNA